jgi:hypothetical protein
MHQPQHAQNNTSDIAPDKPIMSSLSFIYTELFIHKLNLFMEPAVIQQGHYNVFLA